MRESENGLASNLREAIAADARLIMLKELAAQVDGRMNEASLTRVLDVFGINRSRDWVRTQMRALEQLGAVSLVEAGSVLVASLTRLGRDHVERRQIVEGVARPSDDG